ncbi:MAG: transglycosylase SLT domain-containing protein [Tepidimonas taiwanensis]|nr:transglycosylase SLT domain-containing protein [Tepidimonas taiwanensis]
MARIMKTMRSIRAMGVIVAFVLSTDAGASGVWTYVDAQGVTHIGNAPAPPVKRLEWLGFDPRIQGLPQPAPASHPARLPGYASVQPLLASAARRHDLDPALVTAVAAAESGFRPDVVSHKGAVGLMQVMPATAARYGLAAANAQHASVLLKDPDLNVQIGARYLADLLRMFDGELELAVAAYNAGEGAVLRYGRRIPPYPETQQYVTRVMRFYRTLTGHPR